MQDIGQSDNPYAQQQNPTDPNAILNDCRAVGRAIDDLESRLANLQRSQRQFISSSGDSSKEVDALSADIMSGYRGLADRVKRIKSRPESQDARNKPQVEALDRRIRKAINSYQLVETQFRKDVQEQQRRQFLIVRPDATEQEIQEATSEGADTQIFQQALMNSDRRGQAQSALSNVRQRHAAIQQIEKTMLELQQLFQDLDAIVMEQEPMVQNVEQRAMDTHENLEQGNVQLDRGIASARAARKKKWICFGICVAIILVIVIIILIWAGVTGKFVRTSCELLMKRLVTNNHYRAAVTRPIRRSSFRPTANSTIPLCKQPSNPLPSASQISSRSHAKKHLSHLSFCSDTTITSELHSAMPPELASLPFSPHTRTISCPAARDTRWLHIAVSLRFRSCLVELRHLLLLLYHCYLLVYCTKNGRD